MRGYLGDALDSDARAVPDPLAERDASGVRRWPRQLVELSHHLVALGVQDG
jgi:hypothetical protein